jgi:hypothetical protein
LEYFWIKGSGLKLWHRILLALIIGGLGLWLRLDAASKLTIDADEDTYINNALHYSQSIRNGNWRQIYKYDQNEQHPILSKLAYAAALLRVDPAVELKEKDMLRKIPASQTEGALWILAARDMAADLGGVAVFFMALINPLAGLFLAFYSSNIRFTSEIYLESVPALTSLLVMITYDQWRKREFGTHKAKSRWVWLAASAVFLGMTGAGKYIYCVVGLAVLIDFAIRLIRAREDIRPRLLTMLTWGILAVAMFFVFNPILWIYTGERLSNSIIFHINYSHSDDVIAAGRDWWYPLYLLGRPTTEAFPWNKGVFYIEPDPWIAILSIFGLALIWMKERPYAIWLGVSIFFLLFWATKWDQYVMIALPTVCLSAALFVEWLFKWVWKRLVKRKVPKPASA